MQPEYLVAETSDLRGGMGDKQCCGTALDDLEHLFLALGTECTIADREHLIEDEDIGIHKAGNGKCQTGFHTGGELLVFTHLILLKFSEIEDFLAFFDHEGLGIAQKCAAQEDVLTQCKIRVEARAEFQQSGDLAVHAVGTLGGTHDAADGFQQCGFSGTVCADDSEEIALIEGKADMVDRPEFLDLEVTLELTHDKILQTDITEIADNISNRNIFYIYNHDFSLSKPGF